jgi:hypothetical protein
VGLHVLVVRLDRLTRRVAVVAVAAGVLAYLAAWALLSFVCLVNAANGLNVLPSPNSWTLRAVYVALAVLVGLLTFRARRDRELSLRRAWGSTPVPTPAHVPGGVAALLVVSAVVLGSMHVVGVWREHNYLRYLPPGMSRDTGLAYGHQACDWLAARRWGRPTGPEHVSFPGGRVGDIHGRRRQRVQSRALVYQPDHVQWHWANSTQRLAVSYIDHLDARQPGPLTQDERRQASVTGSAWFELCPFQQWVHRPVGGAGSGGD